MRFLAALVVIATLSHATPAHFVFVYVPAGMSEVRIVFGHKAEPDASSFPTRAERTVLTARDRDGKETRLVVEKGEGNFFRAKLADLKPVVIFGTNEAGVTQRGENPPMLSWDYPKVIVGDPFAKETEVGKGVLMEVVPVKDGERVRFKVLMAGMPLSDAELTVGVPGKDEDKTPVAKTDKDGFTVGFTENGRYCVAGRYMENKPGEMGGKKYSTVRHTATVVFDFTSKK